MSDSLINLALSEVPDLQNHPGGKAVIRCRSTDTKKTKAGEVMHTLCCEVNPGMDEGFAPVYIMLIIPQVGITKPDNITMFMRKLKNTAIGFGIPNIDSFQLSDFIGREANVILKLKKDDEYGDKTEVTRFES